MPTPMLAPKRAQPTLRTCELSVYCAIKLREPEIVTGLASTGGRSSFASPNMYGPSGKLASQGAVQSS